jgi:RNA polymerase sigma-70 factor (ECF subfamily)
MRFFSKIVTKKSDEELLHSLGRGNSSALDELYSRYAKRIVFYCTKMLSDPQKAEDIVHDIFLKIIENPSIVDTQKSFSTWVFSCAYNACKNEYRRRQTKEIPHNELDEHLVQNADFIHDTDITLFKELLEQSLDELSSEHRTVFVLRYTEDFSLKEIANVTGIPEGTVKSRLYYAVKKLAQQLHSFSHYYTDIS